MIETATVWPVENGAIAIDRFHAVRREG